MITARPLRARPRAVVRVVAASRPGAAPPRPPSTGRAAGSPRGPRCRSGRRRRRAAGAPPRSCAGRRPPGRARRRSGCPARAASARRSAWRATASRDRASSSIRRALAIARAAWSASARTSATWGAVNASRSAENTPSAPNVSPPAAIGATTSDWIPTSRTNRSVASAWTKLRVARVVAGDDDPAVRDGACRTARRRPPAPASGSSGPGPAPPMPGVVGEPHPARSPGRAGTGSRRRRRAAGRPPRWRSGAARRRRRWGGRLAGGTGAAPAARPPATASGPADGTVTGARAGGPRPRESTRAAPMRRTSSVPRADRRTTTPPATASTRGGGVRGCAVGDRRPHRRAGCPPHSSVAPRRQASRNRTTSHRTPSPPISPASRHPGGSTS